MQHRTFRAFAASIALVGSALLVPAQGRGGEIRHRRWCHLSIHVERVYKGPDPNGEDWILKRRTLMP